MVFPLRTSVAGPKTSADIVISMSRPTMRLTEQVITKNIGLSSRNVSAGTYLTTKMFITSMESRTITEMKISKS